MGYMDKLQSIVDADVKHLEEKGEEYGDTWKEFGGVGAFFVTAQKWKRLKRHATRHDYNVFDAAKGNFESVLDDIGDLRRYLLLIEAEVRAQTEQTDEVEPESQPPQNVVYTWLPKGCDLAEITKTAVAVTNTFARASQEAKYCQGEYNVYAGELVPGTIVRTTGLIIYRALLVDLEKV